MSRQKHFVVNFSTYVLDPADDRANTIESVQAPDDEAPMYPQDGLNVFYGKRFALQSLNEATKRARSEGKALVPVNIEMEAWRPEKSPHWFDTMDGKTIFDTRRLSSEQGVETLILKYWAKYMRQDGFSNEEILRLDRQHLNYLKRFPSYLDRLRKEPEFRHVDAFIWQVEEGGKVHVRATIYNPEHILSVRPVSAKPYRIVLPKKMEAKASKLRAVG